MVLSPAGKSALPKETVPDPKIHELVNSWKRQHGRLTFQELLNTNSPLNEPNSV